MSERKDSPALERMEKAAQAGADTAKRTRQGESFEAQMERMLSEACAQGYRLAVQQLRLHDMGEVVEALDDLGAAYFGENYRTLDVDGEPKR